MKITQNALLFAVIASTSNAFTTQPRVFHTASRARHQVPTVFSSPLTTQRQMTSTPETDQADKLRAMAAKLREEAANLEAEQSQVKKSIAEKAFRQFDTNQDGEISLEELKAGLEKTFKLKAELPQERVQQLMQNFDQNGDGVLQSDEFVSVEQFRNRLDALVRQERALEREKQRVSQAEQALVERMDEELGRINDGTPTGTDKLLSVLPYLLPLLDGLQYASFLVLKNPDNALATVAGVLYAIYRSIPLGGFLAFFALSTLSRNPNVNRLIRFNMQQAIFLDIALIFPGLLAGFVALTGVSIPPEIAELGSDAVLGSILLTIAYAAGSSLLGKTPENIPFISQAVQDRVPTVEEIKANAELFIPQLMSDEQKKDQADEKKDDK